MRVIHRSLRIVAFVCVAAIVRVPDTMRAQSAAAVIDRAVSAWSSIRTIRASFDQTLTNPLTGSVARAHGVFQQQRPGKLSIVFNDEGGDRIIDDGRYLWVYLPSSAPGQVIRRPALDAVGAAPIDLSAQFLDEPRLRFNIALVGKEAVDGVSASVLTLLPKQPASAPFTRAKVWVGDGDGLIHQFETEEPSGVTRRVRLTAIQLNERLDPSSFVFTTPKGVKLVEQ